MVLAITFRRSSPRLHRLLARGGETCAEPGDRVKNTSPLSVELAVRPAAGVRYAMSERTSQLITICMLVGAFTMIGLALSGTLQMSRLPVAQVATK
jgi:hypothetical protein